MGPPEAGRQYGLRRIGAAAADSALVPLDLPICASDPLAMASWGVNRITESGRVAAPEQRISVHDALRAITIESAHRSANTIPAHHSRKAGQLHCA